MWARCTSFGVILLGYFLAAAGRPHGGDGCDERLTDAVQRFVATTKEHNYLFWLLGVGHTTKEDVHRLGAALQLDLFDPGQQKEVAIMLCHSPSLTFLSRMLGINFTPMDDFIERYVNDPRADGNLDAMFQAGEVAMEFLTWMDDTNYPLTPLENTDAETTQAFLEDIQQRISRNEVVDRIWRTRNVQFPVKGNAKEISLFLSEKHSPTVVSEVLEFPRQEIFAMADMDSDDIRLYLGNIAATMRLYRLLDQYGILDITWE